MDLYWSPDGSELLISWGLLPTGGICGSDIVAWRAQPVDWQLVTASDGAFTTITDSAAVWERWYPQPRLSLACDGVEDLDRKRWFSCDGGAVDITIAGDVIDSGIDVRLIGVLESSDGGKP